SRALGRHAVERPGPRPAVWRFIAGTASRDPCRLRQLRPDRLPRLLAPPPPKGAADRRGGPGQLRPVLRAQQLRPLGARLLVSQDVGRARRLLRGGGPALPQHLTGRGGLFGRAVRRPGAGREALPRVARAGPRPAQSSPLGGCLMPSRVLLSWSSGKDSAWALHVLRQQPDV